MRPLRFNGTYVDALGSEPVVWNIRSSARRGCERRYEISTAIRDVDVWGFDFDGLEPVDRDAALTGARLSLDTAGELDDCVLSGQLPCTAHIDGEPMPIAVCFELDLRRDPGRSHSFPRNLRLSTTLDGTDHVILDEWFEEGVLRLDAALRPHRLQCCVTCLYGDYSPAGHGLMGIRCHRDAKEQYLRVETKADYWPVPVTEEVPETYLCDQYRIRIPGTGYRG